ncbi:MAG TPA: efflux RND transporter permease subunit [Abditibacteriaceae bacterium]|nr:efflux RND transporter permease subunit [Abditibacteriaceae bacterium]
MTASENTPTPTPAKKKSTLPLVAAALVGVGLIAFLLGRSSAPNPNIAPATEEHAGEHGEEEHGEEHGHEEHGGEEIKFEGDAAKTAGIAVAPVSVQPQTAGIPFNGQIAPNPNAVVRVSSLVPGRVSALYVAPGDNVRKGQTLAMVESRAIGEAQSAYQQALARELESQRRGEASAGGRLFARSHRSRAALATVVIGGLITSTLLTLFVLPTLYNWFERDELKGVGGEN